jgi:hypothetical protein
MQKLNRIVEVQECNTIGDHKNYKSWEPKNKTRNIDNGKNI